MITQVIPVSAAVHSYLMEPAKENYLKLLNSMNIQDPKFPIISFVTNELLKTKEELIKSYVDGLTKTVNFEGCVRTAINFGCRDFIELASRGSMTKFINQIKGNLYFVLLGQQL